MMPQAHHKSYDDLAISCMDVLWQQLFENDLSRLSSLAICGHDDIHYTSFQSDQGWACLSNLRRKSWNLITQKSSVVNSIYFAETKFLLTTQVGFKWQNVLNNALVKNVKLSVENFRLRLKSLCCESSKWEYIYLF